MQPSRAPIPPSLVVFAVGALWGFYWLPVRRLAELSLPGAWGTAFICAIAACLLAPMALRRRDWLARADGAGLAALIIGGAAFTLYSVAFVYGRVAMVALLFFLAPVWSVLIARFVMGWPTSRLRVAAIVVGLVGLAVMLGSTSGVPAPRGPGEWLALLSGMLWAVATTGIRSRPTPPPAPSAFVFALGACAAALLLAPLLEPAPEALARGSIAPSLAWATAAGGLWWGLSIAALTRAAALLEPARVSILLMAEVLVGAASAAWLAGEPLGLREIAGGALVLCAGVLEVWPGRAAPCSPQPIHHRPEETPR